MEYEAPEVMFAVTKIPGAAADYDPVAAEVYSAALTLLLLLTGQLPHWRQGAPGGKACAEYTEFEMALYHLRQVAAAQHAPHPTSSDAVHSRVTSA